MTESRGRHSSTIILSAVIFALVMIATAYYPTLDRAFFPIRTVRIESTFQFLTHDEVEEQLTPWVDKGFFSLNLAAIRGAAIELPWVRQVEARRIWPDQLQIKIDEQRPVARWGKNSLLNPNGERFSPPQITQYQALPHLEGTKGGELVMLKQLRAIRYELATFGLRIKKLTVNQRQSWSLLLDNGMVIQVGVSNRQTALKRLLKAIPILGKERVDAIATIDLRYPNGMAIQWKPAADANRKRPG